MDRLKEFCSNLTSTLQRKLLGQVNGSDYGDLVWVVRPELATNVPRRAWRQDLDRIAVTTLTRPGKIESDEPGGLYL